MSVHFVPPVLFVMELTIKTGRSVALVSNQIMTLLQRLRLGESVRHVLQSVKCDIGDEVHDLPLSDQDQGEVKVDLAQSEVPVLYQIWKVQGKMYLVKLDRTPSETSKKITAVDLSLFSSQDKKAKRSIASEIVKLKFDRLAEKQLDEWLGVYLISTSKSHNPLSLAYQPELGIIVAYCLQTGVTLEDFSRFVAYARVQKHGIDALGMALMVVRDKLLWREVYSDRPYDLSQQLALVSDPALGEEALKNEINRAIELMDKAQNTKDIDDAAGYVARAILSCILSKESTESIKSVINALSDEKQRASIIRLEKMLYKNAIQTTSVAARNLLELYTELVIEADHPELYPSGFMDRAKERAKRISFIAQA